MRATDTGSNGAWTGSPGSNGASSEQLPPSGNGSSPAVATPVQLSSAVAEQRQALQQLQNSAHELQMRLLRDQQALGSASAALQVHSFFCSLKDVDGLETPAPWNCITAPCTNTEHFAGSAPAASIV